MNRLFLTLIVATVGGLLASLAEAQNGPYAKGQVLPPAPAAARVLITKGPELESARDGVAILRWTTNNPGGSDEHLGIVHYGTDPKNLGQIAKSPNTINHNHPETIFRVRVDGLKPDTTYYYTVDSMQANGKSDGVKSPVKHFTTPSDPQHASAAPAGREGHQ
jgi:phosphodiesterase/alkaline phosphatase D-like protein